MTNDSNTILQGSLKAARYAFMPNKLRYCGGDKNSELFAYAQLQTSDLGLLELLNEFQTMQPYLQLIAQSNQIANIFDPRVVEAYWLGNDLLKNTTMKQMYWHFIDNLKLKKKMPQNNFCKIENKISAGAFAHHNFHVIDVFSQMKNLPPLPILQTINSCIINWGKITEVYENELQVQTPQIIIKNNKLQLSQPQTRKITFKILGKSFIKKPQPNDRVSIHWDWACEVISKQQAQNLQYYTNQALQIFNSSMT